MTTGPSTPQQALARRLATDPASPLLTYYDNTSGERVELSALTFANWVAKLANLLRDGVGLGDQPVVTLALPAHWQTIAAAHAVWEIGGAVALPDEAGAVLGSSDVLMRQSTGADTNDHRADEVLTFALAPLAMPGPEQPAEFLDVDREVRTFGDRYAGPVIPADAPALLVGATDEALTHAELLARALEAIPTDAPTNARLSIQRDADQRANLTTVIDAVVVALVSGGSVVLSVGPIDGEAYAQRLTSEQAMSWR